MRTFWDWLGRHWWKIAVVGIGVKLLITIMVGQGGR